MPKIVARGRHAGAPDDITVDEIDEALAHAAATSDRGPAWVEYVDFLLDERLEVGSGQG